MKHTSTNGFMAFISVLVLATGTLAFSLATMQAATLYADAAYRRELRIQAKLYSRACLDSVSLMAAKNYFLSGEVQLKEFNCVATVRNDFSGNVMIRVNAVIDNVSDQLDDTFSI